MKKIFIILLFAISLFVSCGKEITILPSETVLTKEQLEEQHQQYFEKLVANEEGWFLHIAGEERQDSVMLHLIFKSDHSVSVKSTTRENMDFATSRFRIYGDYNSLLKFEEASVFSLMQYKENAPIQFIIDNFTENLAHLRRADGYNDNVMLLTPFDAEQQLAFEEKQDSVYDLLEYEAAFAVTKGLFVNMLEEDFDSGADKRRFNVFNIGDYGFHWTNIDTITSKITFEFVPPYTPLNPSYVKYQNTYSYEFFPGGMKFTPAIAYGTLEIDKILFDTYDSQAKQLIVTEAGNVTEPVTFGYSNQEAFYYAGITTLFSKEYFTPASASHTMTAPQPVVGYFSGRYADLASQARLALNEGLANSQFSVILRVNNSGSGGGTMIQIYSNAANIMFKCDFVTEGKNVLKIKNLGETPTGTPGANYTPAKREIARQYLYDTFCGEEGFYIQPLMDKVPDGGGTYAINLLNPDNSEDQIKFYIGNNTGTPSLSSYYEQYTR
ncbi:DUF4302 domain-containing protein [Sphingobacterium sp. SGG-5]|uniref:DUF4302 domain-containing protein n=1 Tax=Sphingobacterium sp. SGG-5 TaxID=2710881 RepID=UPI0013EDF497|nr:DUF4302 domain-containing protein [Sphingobacterium sp. SGG-5]NGM61769.1 DUF4302 domain-containing protein [Sphingobacterium sp. SGG-5]